MSSTSFIFFNIYLGLLPFYHEINRLARAFLAFNKPLFDYAALADMINKRFLH